MKTDPACKCGNLSLWSLAFQAPSVRASHFPSFPKRGNDVINYSNYDTGASIVLDMYFKEGLSWEGPMNFVCALDGFLDHTVNSMTSYLIKSCPTTPLLGA